ncbi:winged helix-turn-helix transcriptional regulator [Erythrobacter donghaensis]|jgi:DNA-binding HxlR family transcriptional regulator|uniref:winged helix-turn-helix transcriptional regulator n=1 Tax=Erythrobacter donghaensis TaxID=267135 RepID=UPI000939CF97|nr:helix-turn-helix domain-containing protein [Erythrobacter donghaensis]
MKSPKVTEKETGRPSGPAVGHGRWYNDACGTAFGLEVIGERWALLVVRELMLGARRFSDLRAALPGISAKVLTERLQALEASGVVARRSLPPPGKAQVYELTQWGLAAEPLIQELGRWAAQSRAHDPRLPLSAVSLMLSLRTMLDREACAAFTGRIGFAIGEERFVAEPEGRELPIRRGDPGGCDAVFHAPSADVIAAGIYAGVPWEELEANAGLAITGDRACALRFARLFGLPAPLA